MNISLSPTSTCIYLYVVDRFKGEGIINASPEACFKHCHPRPESTRSQWDSSIKTLEIVEMIQDNQWPVRLYLATMFTV